MAYGIELNHNETIEAIGSKAKADGDQFWMKVFRRTGIGSPPVSIATFENAQATHFQNPETWLPRLAGGGPTFILQAYHCKETSKMVGGPILFSCPVDASNPVKDIDTSLPTQPGWNGPVEMSYPYPDAARGPRQSAAFGISVPPGNVAGNGVANNGNANVVGGALSQQELLSQWQASQNLNLERERLQAQSRALEEERRKFELENVRRESDARIKALENSIANAAAHARPQTDITQVVTAIVAAATPIVTALMQSNAETRRESEKARTDQAQQTQTLLMQMLTRPLVDPTVLAILDKKNSEPPNQMLHQVTESMGSVMQVAMDALRTAAEMQQGGQPEESGTVKTMREISKMVGSLTAGFQASALQQRAQQQQAPRQPPPQQRRALPQPPSPQVVQQPVPVTQFQKPNGNSAEAQKPAILNPPEKQPEPQRLDGVEEEEELSLIDHLKELITNHHNPIEVAKEVLENLGDEELQAELAEVGGSFNELIVKHFGEWIAEDGRNLAYLQLLMEELNRQGAERGLLNAEEAAAELEGDDDGDEAEA